jgi:hypothetical protein
MNIFVLDEDIKKCARYHCNKHVVKMILEYAQLLCTAIHVVQGDNSQDGIYRKTHVNHPCSKWVRESRANWLWLQKLTIALNDEYRVRYNHDFDHKSAALVRTLHCPQDLTGNVMTPFALAMPDHCKIRDDGTEDVVASYRNYYVTEKKPILIWGTDNTVPWI